jgi:hypothetical protein
VVSVVLFALLRDDIEHLRPQHRAGSVSIKPGQLHFAIKAEKVLTAVAKMYHLGMGAAHVIAGLLPPATPQ